MDEQRKMARIRELNDLARSRMGMGSKVMMTQGIAALAPDRIEQIRREVETFSDFTEDNDPHGEHDAGFLYLNGTGEWVTRWTDEDRRASLSVMWKIDYYDKALEYGSEEPWNPAATTRVLTILLTSEY